VLAGVIIVGNMMEKIVWDDEAGISSSLSDVGFSSSGGRHDHGYG
jgi:hypothetical protein